MKKKTLKNSVVYIIGPNALQNELLGWFLEAEAGITSASGQDFETINQNRENRTTTPLVLFDCLFTDPQALWLEMESFGESQDPLHHYALFNVTPSRDLEREAIARKVRGIFFGDMSLSIIQKGILAILEGELWFSRGTLSHYFLENGQAPMLPHQAVLTLTPREKEILGGLVAGKSNQEIAESLFISLHTVKSHIYNVFKKINVTNRLQAAQWVARNMQRP